mmetsp:Transcript_4454/g.13508  ORF Transcript_4454/g.13508 Transcript_4454/m.13508 type:complete len:153 (+) Transcript_4454:275-733(+)
MIHWEPQGVHGDTLPWQIVNSTVVNTEVDRRWSDGQKAMGPEMAEKASDAGKSKVKWFMCPENGCKRRFNKRWNLSVHMRLHTGELPYKCRGCGKDFRWRSSLKSHETTHPHVSIDETALETDELGDRESSLSKMRIEALISPHHSDAEGNE